MKNEIIHFTNVEGVGQPYGEWEPVVSEYLKSGYKAENPPEEITVSGVTYKVMKRSEVVAFYDADGNTLFDVTYDRLDSELESPEAEETKEEPVPMESADDEPQEELQEGFNEAPDGGIIPTEPGERPEQTAPKDCKADAIAKLKGELDKAKDNKDFAEPIIGYLTKRCEEDNGLAQDVMQEHKTWEKCFDYIYSQARKQAKNNRAAVRDDVVYEWAEDYYHKDDKAEEEKKAKEAAERKKKDAERKKKAAEKKETKEAEKVEAKKESAPKKEESQKPKKNQKEMDGQMDLFSMMGM